MPADSIVIGPVRLRAVGRLEPCAGKLARTVLRGEHAGNGVFLPDGKASKPTEFGKMVKIQEAEQQIVTHYEVYDERPSDSDLLVPALDIHEQQFGRPPRLVAADAGFFSAHNEAAAHARGVKRVSIPNRSTKSPERKKHQKLRWFRNGQKWRTGAEGRISLLKRRHGLNRCRYKGLSGIKRWVGLGVISDCLINIGLALAASAKGGLSAIPSSSPTS
jgi:DDE family transposase